MLAKVVDGDFSVERLLEEYVTQEADGLFLRIGRGTRLPDVEFLRAVEGLRYVELDGRVADDTAAFELEGVRQVVLTTRCKLPVPEVLGPELVDVAVDCRAGLANLVGVRRLVVWGWRATDLEFLSGAEQLVSLDVECHRQILSLDALKASTALEHLKLDRAAVASLAPLRELSRLEELLIFGAHDSGADAVLDLADLTAATGLRQLTLTNGGFIRSVDSLPTFAELEAVRLRGTAILYGDTSVLDVLEGRGVTVVRPEE